MIVKRLQPETAESMSRRVYDANSMVGERVALVELLSENLVSEGYPRCQNCYDDVYYNAGTNSGYCEHCFGTTYQGGIYSIVFMSVIFGAPKYDERIDKAQGEGLYERVDVQFPAIGRPKKRDYVLRIGNVSREDLSPELLLAYTVETNVQTISFKDGFSAVSRQNVIGYQAECSRVIGNDPINSIKLSDYSQYIHDLSSSYVIYPYFSEYLP